MYNTKLIGKLCKKYHFKYTEYFGDIKIISPSDVWLIKVEYKDRIQLYHSNKRQGTGFHHQKLEPKRIQDCFTYIYGHEHKGYHKYNKMFRIKKLLDLVSEQSRSSRAVIN